MDKLNLSGLGERLKTGGAQMGRMVSGKMKEILQAPTKESKVVDEATLDTMEEPNWGLNLRICSWLNSEEFSGTEVVRAIKKKISGKNIVSQRLSLDLLETCAMNCEKVFSEIASEKVLDEIVKMIDNPQTHHSNKLRGLQLIKAWGESADLDYLPVFRQTYESVKARAVPSPRRGEPTSSNIYASMEGNVDPERLVPPERYPMPITDPEIPDDTDIPHQSVGLSAEGKKEFLVITRNSIELLSSMLEEAEKKPEEKDDDNDLMVTMVERCKESQPMIQRMIESTNNDDEFLFEALNLHDNLQQIISKYDKMKEAHVAVEPESRLAPEVSETFKENPVALEPESRLATEVSKLSIKENHPVAVEPERPSAPEVGGPSLGSSPGGEVKVSDEPEKLSSSQGQQ